METFARSTAPEGEKERVPSLDELEVLFANNEGSSGAGVPFTGSDSITRE